MCPQVIVETQEPTDIHETVLFGRHGAAVSVTEQFPRDRQHWYVCIARFPLLDEKAVFRKPAGVEEQRDAVPIEQRPGLADILHRNRLASAAVVGDGDHHERNAFATDAMDSCFQPIEVHVPLEWEVAMWVVGFFDHQIERLSMLVLNVGPGRVEVNVVGDAHAGLDDRREQKILGHPTLVCWNNMFVAEDRSNRFFQVVIVLLPAYDSSPSIMPAHCRSLIADVPLSVKRSMETLSAGTWKRLYPASRSSLSRSCPVVRRIGSTTLILNGSDGKFILLLS